MTNKANLGKLIECHVRNQKEGKEEETDYDLIATELLLLTLSMSFVFFIVLGMRRVPGE